MRGASALEKVLEDDPASRVRAFVVWEPVLWTDFSPSTRRLASIPDTRVSQYWDPEHVRVRLGHVLRVGGEGGISSQGAKVRGKRVAWDLILLFPPGSCASGALPEPVFHGDPVVTSINEAREHLRALVHHLSHAP